MNQPRNRDTWPHIATVELGQNAISLVDLVADPTIRFSVEMSPQSPPGFQWLQLHVDESLGSLQCVRTAHALLKSLQKLAATGVLPDFRIVSGDHWLTVGEAVAAIEPDVLR